MSIQITITGANASEAVQLVQDLAGTMSGMNKADIPARTEVSTLPAQTAPQQAPVPAVAPISQPYIAPAPVAPTAVPTQVTAPTPTAVPTTAPSYTLEQLAVAATPLMDNGKQAELTQLLNQQFGVQALTALPRERYGEFATALRQLGAQI